MSSYFCFQLKKVSKHNLTVVALAILLLSFGLLYMNANLLRSGNSLKGEAQSQIVLQKRFLIENKRVLKRYSPKGQSYKTTAREIKKIEGELKKNQAFVADINHGRWQKVYAAKLVQMRKTKETNLSPTEKDWVKKTRLRFAYLKDHPMPYESDASVTGVQFLLQLNETYWPLLFSLVMVFILTYLFTSSYKNGLDTSTLLPLSRMQNLLINGAAGLVINVLIFLLI